jgi:hypothetical protein
MSEVHVSLVSVAGYSQDGKPVDCPSSLPIGTPEVKTSTTGPLQYTLTATAALIRKTGIVHWRVANMGVDNIYVVFGTNPSPANAAAGAATGFGIPAGGVEYFTVGFPDQKIAVINA